MMHKINEEEEANVELLRQNDEVHRQNLLKAERQAQLIASAHDMYDDPSVLDDAQ